jgi:TIR domain-containing protein
MASIFISYRRADAGGHAGRLCDRLTARFGGDRVFLDIQDIHPGQNFATSIEETIATCTCVIAVIGPHWLDTIRARAPSGADFVLTEIGAALKRRVTLIPVLVGGATMPAAADLPAELAELSFLNAVEIRDEHFDQDVEELEKFLASLVHAPAPPAARPPAAAGRGLMLAAAPIVLACAIGGYLWLRPSSHPQAAAVARAPAAPAEPAVSLDGDWLADMQKPGEQPFRIRLRFQQVGDSIGGVVRYPTGDGPMHDVALRGHTLTFATTHTPQFSSEPTTIRFQCDVREDGIRVVVTYDGGVATGVARRATPR